jgi:hypothetical protein
LLYCPRPSRVSNAGENAMPKHLCARGRIALSGVGLRSQRAERRVEKNIFPKIAGVKLPQVPKVKKTREDGVS